MARGRSSEKSSSGASWGRGWSERSWKSTGRSESWSSSGTSTQQGKNWRGSDSGSSWWQNSNSADWSSYQGAQRHKKAHSDSGPQGSEEAVGGDEAEEASWAEPSGGSRNWADQSEPPAQQEASPSSAAASEAPEVSQEPAALSRRARKAAKRDAQLVAKNKGRTYAEAQCRRMLAAMLPEECIPDDLEQLHQVAMTLALHRTGFSEHIAVAGSAEANFEVEATEYGTVRASMELKTLVVAECTKERFEEIGIEGLAEVMAVEMQEILQRCAKMTKGGILRLLGGQLREARAAFDAGVFLTDDREGPDETEEEVARAMSKMRLNLEKRAGWAARGFDRGFCQPYSR